MTTGASATCRRPPPDRFALSGPSGALDPRVHAYRRDIADIGLADRLFAPRYARSSPHVVTAGSIMVRAAPAWDATAVSQLMRGEGFAMFDMAGDWAWGRCAHDDYVGYVPLASLGEPAVATHRIAVAAAPLFGEPDIKSAACAIWPVGSRFAGEAHAGFVATGGGFIHARHATPIAAAGGDPVAFAERLLGLPYLWGGRGGGGIDCSGLVQMALALAGHDAPRDSDQQREALGRPLPGDAPLRRGDLIFFPGHVGMMADDTRLLHANAYWMTSMIEPLADVVARFDRADPILARRRIAA